MVLVILSNDLLNGCKFIPACFVRFGVYPLTKCLTFFTFQPIHLKRKSRLKMYSKSKYLEDFSGQVLNNAIFKCNNSWV